MACTKKELHGLLISLGNDVHKVTRSLDFTRKRAMHGNQARDYPKETEETITGLDWVLRRLGNMAFDIEQKLDDLGDF